ncbi:heparinase II/III-family protein [Paucibacter oligotrophus]|uniref:Heparinase II/III-family protein n=2 Tax=Roseateles oligotrophus TaxID=1769250 RepID=A0ABT2YJB3_9BURK|nr:heparinase II/III-family protein [Roseateles oligotrophus]
MDPPAKTGVAPTLPAPQSNFSPDIRMASLRGGDWQVFVHFGQKTINHAQEEALTYELVHGKTSISRDAGADTSYSSAKQNEYFIKGVGNNVPLIDGLGQEQWALGEVKGFNPVAGTLEVLHPSYRKDASARRSYKLDANGFSETSRITVTAANATVRRLGVMFNTGCAVQVSDPRAGVASASAAPLGSPGFKHWTGVLKHQAQATWTAKLACASGKNYEMTIAGPGPHTVYRATAPNTPLPATRTALYVETSGVDASFTTSIKAMP